MIDCDKLVIEANRKIGGRRWGNISVEYLISRFYNRTKDYRLHQSHCQGNENCTCRVQFVTKAPAGMAPATWAQQSYEGIGDTPETSMLLTQDDTGGCTTFWVGGHLSGHLAVIKPEFRDIAEVHLHIQSGIARIVVGDAVEKFIDFSAMRIDTLWELFKLCDPLGGCKNFFKDGEDQWGGLETVEETMQSIEPRAGRIYVWLPPEGQVDIPKILEWAAVFDGDDLPYGTDIESEDGMRAGGYVPYWEKETA